MHPTPCGILRHAAPCLLLALLAPPTATHAQPTERIWGTVHTTDGARHEGFLRFGGRGSGQGHAANWTDLLLGRENIREEPFRVWIDSARGGGPFLRTVELKGYRISWNELSGDAVRYVRFAVPFGSVQEIIVHGEVAGLEPRLLSLGARVEAVLRPLNAGAGDGTGERERRWLMGESALFWVGRTIEVDDGRGGREQLGGPHISRIEFSPAPSGPTTSSERLYGTIEDASGRQFTGLVSWRDWKLSPSDMLDGWTDRSSPPGAIAFGSIRSVERLPDDTDDESEPGIRVTMANGEVVDLPDRTGVETFSIVVLDHGLGRVTVSSRNFRSLRFHDPVEGPGGGPAGSAAPDETGYDAFGNGAHLRGAVVTRSGAEYEGRIRWGTPKNTTWDHLRGNSEGVGMYVRFARIRRVELLEFPYPDPVSRVTTDGEQWRLRVTVLFEQSRVRVTLLDGRSYEMTGVEDLGELNVGILVLPSGQGDDSGWRRVGWEDLREVRFDHPATSGVRPPNREGWQ